MGIRIGDALVRKGLVSTQQLDQALDQQNETGGVLGANLLELGFVRERELGQTLAEQHRVRCAPAGTLRDVQEPARKALSRPLLWKHRSVPFKLQDGTRTLDHIVPAESPLDFPLELALRVERVGPDALERPVVLDDDLGVSGTRMTLRGTAPLAVPSHVMVDQEWVAVNGTYPRFGVVERAARATVSSDHRRGTTVLIPEAYEATARLAADGRRVRL